MCIKDVYLSVDSSTTFQLSYGQWYRAAYTDIVVICVCSTLACRGSILSILWCLCVTWVVLFLFFFFQAEDGIRDYKVTGVQTCALPICVDNVQSGSKQVEQAGRSM